MIRLVHVLTVPDSLLFLTGQIAFMKRRGFDITVISSPGDALARFGEREGVAVRAVDMPRRITPARDLASVHSLTRSIRELRPHILHAHTPKGGLLGMLAASACSVPVRLYHMRGLPFMTATGPRRALLATTERVSCSLAHRVLCVSNSLRDVAVGEKLVAPSKIQVLLGGSGNGVDCDGRFSPSNLPVDARARTRAALGVPLDALVIGFVGRIVGDKGIEELWRSWRILRAQFPELHLVVVGPFEATDPVSDECRRGLETDPRAHLRPFTADTPSMYAAMDIVALPTYREGFPNVPLEAASMGLPVVATRVAGCVDAVVDGLTGTLVEARDATGLARALESYVRDPALRRRHGEAGRARVLCDFRPEAIWEGLDGVYRELLGRARSSATTPRSSTIRPASTDTRAD